MTQLPNTALQRTRLRAPLSRKPLGVQCRTVLILGRREVLICLVVASVFLCTGLVAQTVPGLEPVPAEQLRGRTFLGPKFSFSVEAPSDAWRWFRVTQGEKAFAEMYPELVPRLVPDVVVVPTIYVIVHPTTGAAYTFTEGRSTRNRGPMRYSCTAFRAASSEKP